jgi:hypothetical protein
VPNITATLETWVSVTSSIVETTAFASNFVIWGQMEVFAFECPELLYGASDPRLFKALGRRGIKIL